MSSTAEPNQVSKNILVCDDNPDNTELIHLILEQEGYSINVAHHGREAINQIRSNSYDLLILNVIMPDMNGHDVIRYIREDLQLNIPVLFLTGFTEGLSTDENVVGIILKPIDYDIFVQQVKSVLS
ncbi:response regulator (plasmid) [Nostoc sp. CENA543]|uniref:response regulator n=1 Tax=Nostoc sp. CENA543 TaxID=1869241 RepID=UPI000CA2762B|nr:response regulator [Nostoc sp. CENA543]AUT04571.1 response regulator [Nostoc sp. CENA543]